MTYISDGDKSCDKASEASSVMFTVKANFDVSTAFSAREIQQEIPERRRWLVLFGVTLSFRKEPHRVPRTFCVSFSAFSRRLTEKNCM